MGKHCFQYTIFIWNRAKPLSSAGKDKLGVAAAEPVRIVLECDGTQIEDGEYFRTLANNTVLLLLRQGERWFPIGVDVIKAGALYRRRPICYMVSVYKKTSHHN